ncbi:MAG: M18 family aminopeptidase [Oscillospiraceae bacterium]|nr:M18 family aminopeptidase [Oscillospiraceae bacterium]
MESINRELLDFIDKSPTAWHAAANVAAELERAGYSRLYEEEDWQLRAPGKYYAVRNGSALIALNLPEQADGFLIMAAHDDSPAFRVKDGGEEKTLGFYSRLAVEKYGGMLCSTWLDRPLSLAGRVAVREKDGITMKLVNIDRDLLVIPNLAIHMDRSANEGKSFNVNVDMIPLIGSAESKTGLNALIAGELGVKEEDIVSRELNLYPRTPGTVWGAENEFISAPRLDDLQCAFGCLKGFLQADKPKKATVLCVFDNEEVGSGTRQGADSGFLDDMLSRAWHALGRTDAQYRAALAGSFMVSADNAHAIHPNHPEFADRSERPVMNGGIVIKFNASMSYTTDGLSAAVFSELCRAAEVPVQRYANRPDLRGGSTLGHISLAHVSVPTLDIGLAQLAMHSSYETAGAKDTEYLARAARAFYESGYRVNGERIALS